MAFLEKRAKLIDQVLETGDVEEIVAEFEEMEEMRDSVSSLLDKFKPGKLVPYVSAKQIEEKEEKKVEEKKTEEEQTKREKGERFPPPVVWWKSEDELKVMFEAMSKIRL